MVSNLQEIELVRHLKPPVDNIVICEYLINLPENQQQNAAMFIIGELAARVNSLSNFSTETAQVLQLDGLSNFLQNNPEYLEHFSYSDETKKISYRGEDIDKNLHGLSITPIDVLSQKLSETFNHRYTFHYKFLLAALKKALKLHKNLTQFENIEYVDRVINNLLTGTKKKSITVAQIIKQTEGLTKKQIVNALEKLGWQKKVYSGGNVVYVKPKNKKSSDKIN